MFYGPTPYSHEAGVQIQPPLHCFETGFVIVPTDPAILAGRAFLPDLEAGAIRASVFMYQATTFLT